MVENGVSAYFHGHDHQYVYETRDGIVYQEVPSPSMTGSGFSGIYTVGNYGDYQTIAMLPNSGHLRITITPTQATVDYISSSNSTNGTVNYTYTIAPNQASTDPTITLTGVPLTEFNSVPGTPSAEKSYTVSGSNLSGNITITPPSDFEISTTSGSGFGSVLTLTQLGGTVSATTIYVRFNRATAGTSNGNITHTSSGASTQNVAVSGTASVPGEISYVGYIGSATSKASGTELSITTNQAVAAGDDIIIVYATDPSSGLTISVSDGAVNTYNEVAVAINQAQLRTYIFAAYNVRALPNGSSITITANNEVTARAAVVSVFRGLLDSGALDKTSTGENDGSATASSGATASTTQANELLIGGIGTEGPDGDTAGTWQNSFTAGPRLGTTGGTADTNITASMGWRIVSAIGTYTASKTGMTARDHASAIATFKIASTTPIMPSYNLLLGRPTDSSVTVNAIIEQGGQAYFEYRTASGSYTPEQKTATLPATAGEPIQTIISGLASNMQYYYRMLFQPTGSISWLSGNEFSFRTQRAQGTTFAFTITSDSHLGDTFSGNTPERYERTTLNVAADNPDFHLDLGDTFITNGLTNQTAVNTKYRDQRPYFGNFSHSAPVFLATGNHENEEGWNLDDTPFSQGLGSIIARKKYFPNPVSDGFYSGNGDLLPGIGGDQRREDYYAWEWGDALFVVLDPFQYTMTKPYGTVAGSGEDADEAVSGDQWNWTLGQQQYNWFKQTLESSNANYKFVFAHHVVGGQLTVSNPAAGPPTYVRGGAVAAPYFEWGGNNASNAWEFNTKRSGWGVTPAHPNGTSIHQLMIDNGVSAFFHGHDHQFVHEVRDGIVYQLVPSAGMNDSGFDLYDSSPYAVSGGNLPSAGHVRVTVSPDQATVEYVRSATPSDPGVINGGVAYSYTIAPGLSGDFSTPPDCDVDGSDLAAWIAEYVPGDEIYVATFAMNFGKISCR